MIYWIWLNTIDGLGPVMQRKLLNHFKNPKNIFDADEYEIMKVKNLGIIRAKEIKNTSLEKSKEILDKCEKNNITVISGMAKGIDGYAHTACLKAGGYTVAFLGSSPDVCYPKEHNILMESIIENGAVISRNQEGRLVCNKNTRMIKQT